MKRFLSRQSRHGKHLVAPTVRTNLQYVRLRLEALENRLGPAGVFPNDPNFLNQWQLHNTGQTGGLYDADIDMPEAWSISTGSMSTVIAVLDSGIDYTQPDLYLSIWINE